MYCIPARRCHAELTIKKSRFIAWADTVSDRPATKSFLQSIQAQYPDASHYCWAYVLGAPRSPAGVAVADDGEPSGTAGKPILNILTHREIGDAMIIVVRYFGGIRLGASGLIRAYSGAAQAVVDSLQLKQQIDYESFNIVIGFDQEQFLRHWLKKNGGELVSISYADSVQCVVTVPEAVGETLRDTGRAQAWKLSDVGVSSNL